MSFCSLLHNNGFSYTKMLPYMLIAYILSLKTRTATKNNPNFLGFFMSYGEQA